MQYVAPHLCGVSFNCPHCGAFAHQTWCNVFANEIQDRVGYGDSVRSETSADNYVEPQGGGIFVSPYRMIAEFQLEGLASSTCTSCGRVALWIAGRMAFPRKNLAPEPNPDLPDEIRAEYDEAASILDLSPRGAAALIRLAIQKLCKHLGQPGKDINRDIAALVKGGISRQVQMALDAIRVIGNESVHPGEIDLNESRETALMLFKLLNLIVEKTISEQKMVQDLYESLPESKRQGIEKRDAAS